MRKIGIVTGTRAEYGLLSPLIAAIRADNELTLQLIVTGTHLAPEFGATVAEIRADHIPISDELEILLSSDTSVGTAKSTGLATIAFADSFRRLAPDVLVLLGDRFEVLAAASAAMIMGIPVAHIHGGERTEGAIDESIRHAVTKMSHLHFVSTKEYAHRVIQMGEHPSTVFHVGAIGLDRVANLATVSREALAGSLQIPIDREWCTATFHPTTIDPEADLDNLSALLEAISIFPRIVFVFTKANADAHGRAINAALEMHCDANDNAVLFDSLGSKRYLILVSESAFVIGNSSSGLIEAPFLRVPTIDIGIRQQGRVRCASVQHVEPNVQEIQTAINACLDPKSIFQYEPNPYYAGGATSRILEALKTRLPSRLKRFFDVSITHEDLKG